MEKKRSVGIKIYGISFFIISLFFLSWGYYFFFAQGGVVHTGLFIYFSVIPAVIFLISGLLTLLLKFRYIILSILAIPAICSFLIVCRYYRSLLHISSPQDVFIISSFLFTVSVFYFFTRPKVKRQFMERNP